MAVKHVPRHVKRYLVGPDNSFYNAKFCSFHTFGHFTHPILNAMKTNTTNLFRDTLFRVFCSRLFCPRGAVTIRDEHSRHQWLLR